MTQAQVFRKAARLLYTLSKDPFLAYSCDAISEVCFGLGPEDEVSDLLTDMIGVYENYFRPEQPEGGPEGWWRMTEEGRSARCIALLLMAEILEDEEEQVVWLERTFGHGRQPG